jgi:hypothetical protein
MKIKLAVALSAISLSLSIAGAQALTVSGSDKVSATRTEVVNVGTYCQGGRRCSGYYYRHGVRVCRGWVRCNSY